MLRADEESGLQAPGPKVIIWACTCLAVGHHYPCRHSCFTDFVLKAAMVLSTSVTFLSLPGLDNIARIAGLVAVLLSTASMSSSVIALFRFKADMERADANLGGEGFIIQPVRAIPVFRDVGH